MVVIKWRRLVVRGMYVVMCVIIVWSGKANTLLCKEKTIQQVSKKNH